MNRAAHMLLVSFGTLYLVAIMMTVATDMPTRIVAPMALACSPLTVFVGWKVWRLWRSLCERIYWWRQKRYMARQRSRVVIEGPYRASRR